MSACIKAMRIDNEAMQACSDMLLTCNEALSVCIKAMRTNNEAMQACSDVLLTCNEVMQADNAAMLLHIEPLQTCGKAMQADIGLMQVDNETMRVRIEAMAVSNEAAQPCCAAEENADSTMTEKRTDYLSWDEYFMAVALLSGLRSKDPNTQVGACVANAANKIIGVGYNGFPWGCSDDDLPWSREGSYLDTKYPYVCHAELNAVLNSTVRDLHDCRIYVALFPCNECSKVIIQSGIREIIYLSDKYKDTDSVKAAKRMFEKSGVKCRQFVPERDSLLVSFA